MTWEYTLLSNKILGPYYIEFKKKRKLSVRRYGFGGTYQKPKIHSSWPTASPYHIERSLASISVLQMCSHLAENQR